MIKKKLWELDLLRLRISPDFIPLLDGYRQTLQEYYKKRHASLRILAFIGPVPDKAVDEAIQRLDALDAQRARMRSQPPVAAAAETATPPAP
jgi:hypothetical protein